jgi:phosphoglycolate phosphatase-like HAD superfamily hydrolase
VIRLVLFDIDGTLVLTGGAGVRGMARAFADLFSVPDAFAGLHTFGRTDSWILSDALELHGIPADTTTAARFRESYIAHLRDELQQPGPRKGIMPGVRALLDALAGRGDVYLALLTGNYEDAARLKLEYFDLWKYFPCGAFGDDAPDRNRLLPQALAKVRECGGPDASPDEVMVIGDTPLDVACAAAGGAHSLAVATGVYSAADLAAAGAEIVMNDLGDLDAVLAAMKLNRRSPD